ncbi:tyrosine-type recombinase/integrase [Aeromonas hydrophila]|uniref:tyrosine-type recombinase/integrase n=1 Tax=Aeromonas hydrophila TaxID=644 RepID=UPI000F90768D|nr:tyrosine-type recombinase/integrase [Aeromonas hydrophila]
MTEKMVVSRNTSVNRLRDKAITDCRPTKVHVLSDGGGLELTVKPIFSTSQASGEKVVTGWNRVWSYRFMRPEDGKRTKMGLGNYPTVTLQHARELKRAAQEKLSHGINPITHRADAISLRRTEQKLAQNTLRSNAVSWFELQKSNVTKRTVKKSWDSLEKHVLPKLGDLPIAEIRNPLIRDTLSELAAQGKIETVEKLCRTINQILDHAVISENLDENRCEKARKQFPKKIVVNQLTIPTSGLSRLLADVEASTMRSTTRALFYLELHTLVRPGEAAGARWDEIDMPNRVWTLPASRMKMREEHKVPLSDQVLRILEQMQAIRRNDYIFPGNFSAKNQPQSSQSVNMALARMGYRGKLVSHGLRSLGSTILHEAIDENGRKRFEYHVIEAALSHADDNKIAAIYNRTKYYEHRIDLMKWWSEYIEAAGTKKD